MSSTTTFGGPSPATDVGPEEHGAVLARFGRIPFGLIWATLIAGSVAAWYVVLQLTLELIG